MLLFGKHINKYYLKYWFFFLIGVLALVGVDWIQLYIPEFLGEIVDLLGQSTVDTARIGQLCLYVFLIGVGMFAGRLIWRYAIFYASMKIETEMRHEMFLKAEALPRNYYHQNKVGAVMAWFTGDLETIQEYFGWGLVMLVDGVFLSILVIIKMLRLDLMLSAFALVPVLLIVAWGAIVEKFMTKKWEERQSTFDKVYDFSQENFTGIRVIKAFVKETKEIHAFAKVARKNADVNVNFARFSVVFDVVIQVIIALIFSLLLGVGGYFVWCCANGEKPFGLETTLTAAKLVTFTGYFDSLIWPMISLGQIVPMVARSKGSLNRISAFLDAPEDVKSPKDAIVLNDVKGQIEFRNFSFTYPETDKPVLKNISLTIKPGECIGIVGKIGSGKTTLANTLLYLYNVAEGSVFIDGNDISKCDIDSLRDQIAFVPQDNFLFSDTIENNVMFSKKDKNMDETIEATEFAAVHDNIVEFKDGYQTISGERGVTLSGGQKQRISIARAFVKKAPIMILDDSVSAVDTKTEETILKNIAEQRNGQTTLVVASRVSTVHKLDKIIVMNNGELEAFDTPERLLKISPTYSKMVALQKLEEEVNEGGSK